MTENIQVLKLGGSTLTRKAGFCEPNLNDVNEWCSFLAREYRHAAVRRIVVLGGGSFGNQIPLRYGFADPSRGTYQDADLFRMTEGMFGWATIFANQLASVGVPPYPIQTSAVVVRKGLNVECYFGALKRALRAGMLPVVTGDLVWGDGTFEILSSDLVAVFCAIELGAAFVDMVTDVRGVYPPGATDPWPRVTSENYEEVLCWCAASGAPDITGGMRLKVKALGEAAGQGVAGWLGNSGDYMAQQHEPRVSWRHGTRFEPWGSA